MATSARDRAARLLEWARAGRRLEAHRSQLGRPVGGTASGASPVRAAIELAVAPPRCRSASAIRCATPPASTPTSAGASPQLDRELFLALCSTGEPAARRGRACPKERLTTALVHPREVFAPAIRDPPPR
jgi:hypothetical protein